MNKVIVVVVVDHNTCCVQRERSYRGTELLRKLKPHLNEQDKRYVNYPGEPNSYIRS